MISRSVPQTPSARPSTRSSPGPGTGSGTSESSSEFGVSGDTVKARMSRGYGRLFRDGGLLTGLETNDLFVRSAAAISRSAALF
jgi:hypothetical protein